MNVLDTFKLGITVLSSLFIVFLVISLGWFLIWKAFLSKFRLVREILGQTNEDTVNIERNEKPVKVKKIRKD